MTITEFYKILNEKYDYRVYKTISLETGKFIPDSYNIYDANLVYVGTVIFKKDVMSFNNADYTDIDEMINAILSYNETLPYSMRYYDPNCNISARTSMAIHDYLIKIGLKHTTTSSCGSCYILTDVYKRPIIVLNYEMKDLHDSSAGILVDLNVKTTEIIHSDFTDIESAIKEINSMINVKCVTYIAYEIGILDKMSDHIDYNLIKVRNTEKDEDYDLKTVIKERLQKIIDNL